MTLLDMQRVFSRMLTDSAYQRAVIDGNLSATSGYDLTTAELACLRALRRDRLAEHTGNLAHTRLEHGLRSLPRTERLVGPALRAAVGRYCRAHPPTPEPRSTILVESDRVARFVADLVAAGELTPPYVRDVVDYENTMLLVGYGKEAADSAQRVTRLGPRAEDASADTAVPVTGEHAVVREFGCDVVDLVRALDASEPPAVVAAAPTTLLFVKRAGLGEVHAARINAATALVLACCTGQDPMREVVFAVAAGLGAREPLDLAALERGVRASLAALARLGAVGFRDGAT